MTGMDDTSDVYLIFSDQLVPLLHLFPLFRSAVLEPNFDLKSEDD